MTTRHFRIGNRYLGGYGDGAEPTEKDAVEVPSAPEDARQIWDGQAWGATPVTAASIAARRYEAEVGGITVLGVHINTDDRSKLLINGAALEATIDPEYVTQWKTAGGFIELTGEQVITIARAVRTHVQGCFDREAELLAALEAGTLTASMLEEGWPQSQPTNPETSS